jgi:hypothetical protein
MVRAVAALGAGIGAFGLGLQFVILYGAMTGEGASPLEATWRYFAYFTILTNVFVTAVLARAALLGGDGALNAPRIELTAVTSILFVCIVYNLLLASRWDPQGWQKLADMLLHNVTPAMVALYWVLRPHGRVALKDALFAALWPLAYAAYGLTRGAFDGYYPYFFMDPTALAIPQLALNLAGLSLAFVIGAALLVTFGRVWVKRASR